MEKTKDFNEWRAKQLCYVYFSRLNDLIISESNPDYFLFDYLIDISESGKQTGRLFGVEVKALKDSLTNAQSLTEQFKNLSFPVLLVAFDNKTDQGYFGWIKEPKRDGRLTLEIKENMSKLDNNSLNNIVRQVKDWYAHQPVFSE